MAKQTIELEVPDGWELTGEFRRAMNSEAILDNTPLRAVHVGQPMGTEGPRLILRKIEPVRESQFINLYQKKHPAFGVPRSTRESADIDAVPGRVGIVRIDYENGVPVHVALEPAEGEG